MKVSAAIPKFKFLTKSLKETGLITCLFFFVNLFFGSLAYTQSNPIDFASLANHKIWLNQLQYRKTIFGGMKSEADHDAFFISKNGKYSPEDELEATYNIFLTAPNTPWGYINQPVLCAFPTRKKFLEEELNIKFTDIPCLDRDQWKTGLRKRNFYIVFSDAFPNNPASMFGHTFVLISNAETPYSAEGLLDYSINFSADTSGSDEKSLFYTLKGLFGGYSGRYRIYPFYQMVNQYINWDSRDLWYIKMPWHDEQIDRFLDHVWEIFTSTHFDYFFFDENCSYRLLSALDYADPKLNLVEEFYYRLPLYYVAPIATYKKIYQRTGSNSVELYSPSIQKSLNARIDFLNPEQKERFYEISNNIELINSEMNVHVLDALVANFDYQKRRASSNYLSEKTLSNLTQSLQRRSQILEFSEPKPKVAKPPSPLSTHPTKSVSLGLVRIAENRYGVSAGGKLGYHDLLSPSDGFEHWSHLNFFETKILSVDNQTKLESLVAVNIISFFPLQFHESKINWRGELGYNSQFYGYGKGGIGLSAQTDKKDTLFYFFLNSIVLSNKSMSSRGFLFDAEIGLVKDFSSRSKVWIRFSDYHEAINIQGSYYLNNQNELRLEGNLTNDSSSYLFSWQNNF